MSATNDELLDAVKDLKRIIHAGFVILAARMAESADNTKTPDEYISKSFLEMQGVLGSLRQGD
jgi:hypothetical protein